MEDRPRHRAAWDAASENELRQRVAAGEFTPDIARAMGRSQEAIRTRANLLGISVRYAAKRLVPNRERSLYCASEYRAAG
jgi:hypothetical protein